MDRAASPVPAWFRSCGGVPPRSAVTASASAAAGNGPGGHGTSVSPPGTLRIGFLGRAVAIDSDAPEVLAGVEPRFRHLLAPGAGQPLCRIEVRALPDHRYEFRNGGPAVEAKSLPNLIERLTYQITLRLMESRPELIWLHAAAVARHGQAVVLPADSGKGKSTLATLLCSRGWSFLADDIVPLDPATGLLGAFPRSPEIRHRPPNGSAPVRAQSMQKTLVDLEPADVCRQNVPARAVVFPAFSPASPLCLTPCSPANAALELLRGCLNFVHHGQGAVAYLCDWSRRVPAFTLAFSDPQEAASRIEGLSADFGAAA